MNKNPFENFVYNIPQERNTMLVGHTHLENSPSPYLRGIQISVPSACPSSTSESWGLRRLMMGTGERFGRQGRPSEATGEPGPRRLQRAWPEGRVQACLKVKVRAVLLHQLHKTSGFNVQNMVNYLFQHKITAVIRENLEQNKRSHFSDTFILF